MIASSTERRREGRRADETDEPERATMLGLKITSSTERRREGQRVDETEPERNLSRSTSIHAAKKVRVEGILWIGN